MKNRRILLVDDEKRILEIFSLMLTDLGYSVKTSSRPDDAIQLVSAERFDIVFLDQFLGPITGLELMHQMSAIDPELYFVIITANGSQELAVEALKKGASDFISKPFFVTDLLKSIEYIGKKKDLAVQKKKILLTLETKVNERTDELKKTHLDVLSSLAQAIEKRDLGTYGHCKRVSGYCELIAAAIGLDSRERHYLGIAATLHDIGKIGISDSVLGKKGPLDDSEKAIIKSHSQKGVEILKPLKHFGPVLPAILHHHEGYDGSGYPHGLSGQEIPLHARIISVADTYDAILSTRPYRPAARHEKALSELMENAGRQFDGEIVRAFVHTHTTQL
ncbi:MAG: response regulator [Nitrospirae bacterium]|nr:response regulator [Nitrospirota bacterium]